MVGNTTTVHLGLGEDEKYWDIAFEGEKDKVQAIPLGDGEWEWEFLDEFFAFSCLSSE